MIEVLKQLVDALQTYSDKHRKTYLLEGAWDEEITKGDAAIKAGKQAIAELESQEPVADDFFRMIADRNPKPFSTPQRTWVGLTEDEIDSYFEDHGWSPSKYYYPVIKDIEARLKEKNGA